MNDLNAISCKSEGTGPKSSVCLIMIVCGIGDDIHAMPSVSAMLANGNEVTVYCREFHRPIWEKTGVRNIVCMEHEKLGLQWPYENAYKYGSWYSLHSWGGWEVDTNGASTRPQFDQFAEIVGVDLPVSYSWIDTLQPETLECDEYTLFAPESAEVWRTLPKQKMLECYHAIEGNVVWLASRGGRSWEWFPELRDCMTSCDSFEELSAVVYSASKVVSVESGISNLAAAYGKKLAVIYGPTEPTHIVGQFSRYIPGYTYESYPGQQPDNGHCALPCWRHPTRGMFQYDSDGNKVKSGVCCGTSDVPLCLQHVNLTGIPQFIRS